MKFELKYFLFFLFLAKAIAGYSVDIKKIDREEGLSNSNVVSIAQDRLGYIWICTKEGLNRFDGISFKVFKKSETGNNSLSSNELNYVYADPFNDVVWIATEKNGLDAYNYRTHMFTHYEYSMDAGNGSGLNADGVTQITGDSLGNLWIATYQGGIDYFDKRTGKFTHYNQSTVKGLGSDYNWCLMQESAETIYAGHVNSGFSIIDIPSKTAVNFRHDPKDPHSLPDNTVTSIIKDSGGKIWIGTRNGLVLFDPETYQLKSITNDPGNPFSLSQNFIQRIIETDDHKLWIGTEGGGINILNLNDLPDDVDPAELKFNHILPGASPDGLSFTSVQTIFQDSFRNIWIGGYGGGLNFISGKESFFKKYTYLPFINNNNSLNDKLVSGICEDKKGQIWIANGNGGICVYSGQKKIRSIKYLDSNKEPDNVLCVFRDSENQVWVGTNDGRIFKYNSLNDTFILLDEFKDLRSFPVYNFFEDSKKNLWISTDIGLHVYNLTSGKSAVYSTTNSDLSDNVIRSIAEDANGNIWVGTLIGGLCVFDPDFKLIINYGSNYDFYSVNHILKDSKNRMWVGSQNDLFLFMNYKNDSVVRIGTDNGLAENDIRAIVEGETADDFWLSNSNGISHIDMNTMYIINFNYKDGVVFADFIPGSVTKTGKGVICFGSQNGAAWFDQALNMPEYKIPGPVITDFLISNTKKDKINIFSNIPVSDTIELKHFNNTFQIKFSILDYSLAGRVEFAFKMDGLDKGWYLLDKDNYVTFRNLRPGKYIFNVRTRLHNTNWSDEIKKVIISVSPPVWESAWAMIFYLVLIVIVLYVSIMFYLNKLKIENSLALEKITRQNELQLNEEKLRFFTNITHELKTPMTLILGPLEDLLGKGDLNADQQKRLTTIHRVANRLLHLINQILEFRRSTTKSRKLRVVKDDFAKFVYDTGMKFRELNINRNIEFELSKPARILQMYFDPEVVTIIIDNLLSNAFKYTRKGTISLKVNSLEENNTEYIEFIVSDTGVGISEKDISYIFERYYQSKNHSLPVSGAGIGLALVQNMVELHEAKILVQSQITEGTTFRVRFLKTNTYPGVEHAAPVEDVKLTAASNDEMKDVILVVDDNQEILEYISDCLSDTYTVISGEDGRVGYEMACENTPDLVITDIMMPVMDGIELCQKLKSDVRTSHIPVIMLTAKGSLLDKSEGYDAGADSYLTKPFSCSLLKSRLKNLLDMRKTLSKVYASDFKDKKILFNESISKIDKDFLENLSRIIESNLEQEEMNISLVASQLNMSHSTLYRKIKSLTNLTANEYIRKVRIKVAEQLLLTNKYTISEIMYHVGINSSSYFRQCFKDEFGLNPSDYLQKLKED